MKKNNLQKGFAPVLIILLLAVVAILIFVSKNKNISFKSVNTSKDMYSFSTPSPSVSSEPTPNILPVVLKASQITWVNPVRVASLNVFKTQKEVDKLLAETYGGSPDLSKFYFVKVGDLSDGSILVNGYAPRTYYYGVSYINFVVKGGSIRAILDEIGYYKDNAEAILSSSIPVEHGRIEGLEIPLSLKANDIELFGSNYPSFEEFNSLVSPNKFADTGSGPVYVVYSHVVAPTPLFDRIFYLMLKNGLMVRYSVNNNPNKYDNSIQKFTWSQGSPNNVAFIASPFWGGCGGSSNFSSQVVKSSDIDSAQKETVGTDLNKNPVYKLTDGTSAVLKEAYKQYSDTHSGNQDEKLVSYEDFLKDNNNILVKDAVNDWVFYINPKYAQLAECGKPVIYLYPTKEDRVNVQVDAKITQSEPVYPVGGWNVIANPGGTISYNGLNYESLFWEGFGNGIYPDVKKRGVVVRSDEVGNRLRQDLAAQGLNAKETNDFLDFWLPRMPKNKFVRLTWLNTFEMNNLAPLVVTPKPDTTIRVFLDFEGIDKVVNLEPQKLFSSKRNGFTLVEWGGLLIK